MNTVKLKLNPFKADNVVSINDRPLSPYSELNNYIKEPLLKWVDSFFDAAEREINDEFEFTVIADDFEAMFLQDMSSNYDCCRTYSRGNFEIATPLHERLVVVSEVANKYGLQIIPSKVKFAVAPNAQVDFSHEQIELVVPEEATFYISDYTNNDIDLSSLDASIVIRPSDKVLLSKVGPEKYLWEVPNDKLKTIICAVVDHFSVVPAIIEAANKLIQSDDVNPEDKQIIRHAIEIDGYIQIGDPEPIEVGKTLSLEFKIFPENLDIPNIRIVPSTTDYITIDGLMIKAKAPGITHIDIYVGDKNIPIARKAVSTYHNNMVQDIELTAPAKTIGVGHELQISAGLIPLDADDAKLVEWSVNNHEIATINDDGKLLARAAGQVVVTAATTRASKQIQIEICPCASKVELSCEKCELFVGQTQPIAVSIKPNNCFSTEYTWKTSDKTVATVVSQDDGTLAIRATGIGECSISFTANDGGAIAVCTVLVESTFKKNEKQHGMLSATLVLTIISVFCSAFSFPIGVIGCAVAAVVCGIKAIKNNKHDTFWAFLLMGVSAIFAVTTAMRLF